MDSATNIAIHDIFQPIITGGSQIAGLDYTASMFTWQNIQRLYARLYPLMMLDFVHQKDYSTFVTFTKIHKHPVSGSATLSPLPPLKIFKPITKAILAATVAPEPFSGLPAKDIGAYGVLWEIQYSSFRNIAKSALKLDMEV